MRTVGIVVFPGSNCDKDCGDASLQVLGVEPTYLWHADVTDLTGFDLVMLPGGFSYGDYLRSGAVARFAPMMAEVIRFANAGGLVLGICNGFQILCEAGLLPGALTRNESMRFICEQRTLLEVTSTNTPFSVAFQSGQTIELPVAHGDGNYQASETVLDELEANDQIIFRYKTELNGSRRNIAGICNKERNVLGMMPHPERNLIKRTLGQWSGDGRFVFDSLRQNSLQPA